VTRREKLDIYRKVVAALAKGIQISAFLGEEGRDAEQQEVDLRNEELAEEAARLRRAVHQAWTADYDALRTSIARVSSNLQGDLRDIERRIAIGEKVVRAIGRLEELVELAGSALA
jgi:hypothetical protein